MTKFIMGNKNIFSIKKEKEQIIIELNNYFCNDISSIVLSYIKFKITGELLANINLKTGVSGIIIKENYVHLLVREKNLYKILIYDLCNKTLINEILTDLQTKNIFYLNAKFSISNNNDKYYIGTTNYEIMIISNKGKLIDKINENQWCERIIIPSENEIVLEKVTEIIIINEINKNKRIIKKHCFTPIGSIHVYEKIIYNISCDYFFFGFGEEISGICIHEYEYKSGRNISKKSINIKKFRIRYVDVTKIEFEKLYIIARTINNEKILLVFDISIYKLLYKKSFPKLENLIYIQEEKIIQFDSHVTRKIKILW